ncbi:hypothetical protein ACWEQ0_23715 [Nocardia thailandica]
MLTSVGDLLLEVGFEVEVAHRTRSITVLVQASDAVTPVSGSETSRLRALVRELDVRW